MMKLKPYPFCVGEADYKTENFGATVWVRCDVCGVQTRKYDTNLLIDCMGGKSWASIAWNRRVSE